MSIDSFVTGVMLTAGAAATAATGGMVAGENQTVVTGDSSASVQVTNVINAGDSSSTAHTEIIKTVDGKTTNEVVDKTYAPGEPVVVETVVEAVSGKSYSQGSSATAHTDSEMVAEAAVSTSTSTIAERANIVLGFLSQLFHSVFGIFSR
jgi:hypothetical protein